MASPDGLCFLENHTTFGRKIYVNQVNFPVNLNNVAKVINDEVRIVPLRRRIHKVTAILGDQVALLRQTELMHNLLVTFFTRVKNFRILELI